MKGNEATLQQFEQTAGYSIPPAYYREAYRLFQSKYIMRRNYILMALFFILLLSFIWSAADNPSNTLQYILGIVCIAAICLLWYNPRRQRRQVFEASKELENDRYTSRCDGKTWFVRRIDDGKDEPTLAESRVYLENAWVRKLDQFYLICEGKNMFYILPEEAIGTVYDEESEMARIKATRQGRLIENEDNENDGENLTIEDGENSENTASRERQ